MANFVRLTSELDTPILINLDRIVSICPDSETGGARLWEAGPCDEPFVVKESLSEIFQVKLPQVALNV